MSAIEQRCGNCHWFKPSGDWREDNGQCRWPAENFPIIFAPVLKEFTLVNGWLDMSDCPTWKKKEE